MERLDWIGGEGFEALRGQRAALVDGPVYTLLDPTEYAVAVGKGDRARLVIVHTKPESAILSIDVGENAKLSVVEMFIDEAFVECSIRQQGGSLCEVTMAELTSANVSYRIDLDGAFARSELDGLFQQDATSISGKLRIDIPPGIAKSLLLPRLSEFLYLHPGIELELSSHDRPVDILHDGFDCVIRTGALPEDGVIARSLGKLTMVNCASPHYLTRFGYPQSPDDLTSHAIVRYTPHLGVHPLGFEVASVNGVQWFKSGGMLTVNSSENYLAAGIAGLGIIQIPRIAVREALRAGRLIEVLPGYRAEPLSLSLVYPQRRELSRRVNLFMQWLAGVMKEHLD